MALHTKPNPNYRTSRFVFKVEVKNIKFITAEMVDILRVSGDVTWNILVLAV